jgi:hypothetical protein
LKKSQNTSNNATTITLSIVGKAIFKVRERKSNELIPKIKHRKIPK